MTLARFLLFTLGGVILQLAAGLYWTHEITFVPFLLMTIAGFGIINIGADYY